MYLPLFFNNKTTPVKYLKDFDHIVLDSQVMRTSIQYEKFIEERLLDTENELRKAA